MKGKARETAMIANAILSGLDHAHTLVHDGMRAAIVHRDVSPHNVMASITGDVKLVDFGLAKAVAATAASRSGALRGKVGYMSPEQAHGLAVDGRADVFAVGIIAHELLTGRRLFTGRREPEILSKLLHQPLAAPSTWNAAAAPMDGPVMAMLERDRNNRPTARQAADQLAALMSPDAAAQLAAVVRDTVSTDER